MYYSITDWSIAAMPPPKTFVIQRQAAPLRKQVLDSLRESIIQGQLAPGERLTERSLTDKLDVSRTVVREALRQLETEGLIEIVPNKGPVVRDLSIEEATDLYRIRGVLEGLTAKLFVENASRDQLEGLEIILDEILAAYENGHTEAVLETKNRFYELLYDGASSEILSSMLATLHARIWRWRALGLIHPNRPPERSRESINNLRAFVDAIKAKDADAAESLIRLEAEKAAEEIMRLLENIVDV